MSPTPQPRCLILDLETVPGNESEPDKIIKIGALRPDTGAELELATGTEQQRVAALDRLEQMGAEASFLLGHNIEAHDLPILQRIAPGLALLQKPAIDTLRLSPLAFPQNPYHRLIKDYKLIRDSLNSPLADCRSTLTLFIDQQGAFTHLAAAQPEELRCYQTLTAPHTGPGLGNFFLALARQTPATLTQLAQWLPALLAETDSALSRTLKVCQNRLDTLIEHDLQQPALHWPLAYALAWLRVSGGNSVLAPWVRHQFPAVGQLLTELRDMPCGDSDCSYCRTTHDPQHELKRYFGFDAFRHETPTQSLQHDIVLSGMRGEAVLVVLATGGGKSLGYQLPALNRYHRNGSLTIILSPLQALMKDQVDGLQQQHNITCAAALNGLLTLPERADVLERIQMGDVGLLLVSPEQFRNPAFRKAIAHRQIGAWVFDEAHCLSKWGNDFRPDYLYVARFIREFSGTGPCAPIGCFTATARPDVLDDIRQHFRTELGMELREHIGTPERDNLQFEVLPVTANEKHARTQQLLRDALTGRDGGAVVFVASRRKAQELAEFLQQQDWPCAFFHAGLGPNEKRDTQDAFLRGELRVIVATNAFGMGVDKPDVRLVVHADIPGALENYLQEAGRAGRDRNAARCVLLYDPRDIETHFSLNERARLNQRDLQEILRKLRFEAGRRKNERLVITTGEILLDDQIHISFEADDSDAETKTVTAISWLERNGFLRREENHTRIFPARLRLQPEEAARCLDKAQLSARRRAEFNAILRFLYGAKADQRIDTDQLMQLTGQTSEEVSGALRQLEALGIVENDTQLTLYLRHGIKGHARERLEHSIALEAALFAELREQAPDADQEGAWQLLHLPRLTAALRERCGQEKLLPPHVLRLLKSLTRDRDGDNQQRSSLELRQYGHDQYRLRIRERYRWAKLVEHAERRQRIAAVLLAHLIRTLPPGIQRKDLLVSTTFGELQQALENDTELCTLIHPTQRLPAIQHVLLYLHTQEILTLNQGMTVMRRAMTIDLNPERQGQRYLKADYQRLDEHYRERRIQVHVMRAYAETALREMAHALRLAMHYFTLKSGDFLHRYFAGKEHILKLATSEESWQAIIGSLNDTQKAIVSDDQERNRLVLAGPGSGKTRVIVHRIAWLLRVRRVPARAIIALTFNRHAANEIRTRLFALVGLDAVGITVLTYHAMAMRLTGTSFQRRDSVAEADLAAVLERAAALLEGHLETEGEDDLRERLLRGYRYILVDEYQDIDDRQYRLVSALAQRRALTAAETGGRDSDSTALCILVVGDDDQNIYAWRGGNNAHIERFCAEYTAEISYMVENYRSSQAIIASANALIAQNGARLKADSPIRIDAARSADMAGGRWHELDPKRRGHVLRLQLPAGDARHGTQQAQVVMAELQRLLICEDRPEAWQGCAVLARTHRYLAPLQAWCEHHAVPYFLAADKDNTLPLARQRAFVQLVEHLRQQEQTPLDSNAVARTARALTPDPDWQGFFATACAQLSNEYGDCQLTPAAVIDWLYDYAREMRQHAGNGLFLGTVHAAKGLEFRHVVLLDGDWQTRPAQLEEERRLYYVGMTRAEETLTLCEFESSAGNAFVRSLAAHAQACSHAATPPDPCLDRRYQTLGLKDIDLSFPGRQPPTAPLHAAIRALAPGDRLILQPDRERFLLCTAEGVPIGRTSRHFQLRLDPEACEVGAILVRYLDDSEPPYRAALQSERWELVVPRLSGRPRQSPG